MTVISTPRKLERTLRFRVGLHTFRWGFHLKVRSGDIWRHLVIKYRRGSAFGRNRARREWWIGWWRSEKGQRRELGGFRLTFNIDRLPERPPTKPGTGVRIPFFPQAARGDDRECEIR